MDDTDIVKLLEIIDTELNLRNKQIIEKLKIDSKEYYKILTKCESLSYVDVKRKQFVDDNVVNISSQGKDFLFRFHDKDFKERQIKISSNQTHILTASVIIAFVGIIATILVGYNQIYAQKNLAQPEFIFHSGFAPTCPENLTFSKYSSEFNNMVLRVENSGKSRGDFYIVLNGTNILFKVPWDEECPVYNEKCVYSKSVSSEQMLEFIANMAVVNQTNNISYSISWGCLSDICFPKDRQLTCQYARINETECGYWGWGCYHKIN